MSYKNGNLTNRIWPNLKRITFNIIQNFINVMCKKFFLEIYFVFSCCQKIAYGRVTLNSFYNICHNIQGRWTIKAAEIK